MTEAEWVACEDPFAMLAGARDHTSGRKIRLVAVAACRGVWEKLTDDRSRAAVEVAEQFADGGASAAELQEAWRAAERYFAGTCSYGSSTGDGFARSASTAAFPDPSLIPHLLYLSFRYAATPQTLPGLLRCIVGNPFRPVTADPAWLTSTVVQLARGIYDDRAFDRLPILADALQDAGCDNADVLEHCRGNGPHARGCWVVDLVLGKS